MQRDYRATLYEDYAESFKNASGQFDFQAATNWAPCLNYYLRRWLPDSKEAEIVDLGCGEGRIIYVMQRMGYTNVYGVDISESQLEMARQVSDTVIQADVLEFLKTTSDRYDLIISYDLIEHLNKREVLEFLDLCATRLKRSGRLVLQTLNASSPFFGSVRYGDLTHETGFTPGLLSQLASRAGFQKIEVREAGPVPKGYSIKSTIRYFLWRLIRILYCLLETAETGGCGDRIYTRVFLLSAVTKK